MFFNLNMFVMELLALHITKHSLGSCIQVNTQSRCKGHGTPWTLAGIFACPVPNRL